MKFVLFVTALLTLSPTVFGQEFEFNYQTDYIVILEQTNDSLNGLYYDKLLARFQNNDTTLTDYEVLTLLIGFTDNENYKPYSYKKIEAEIYELNDNGEHEEALAICDSILTLFPVSQQALIEKSYAHHKLNNHEQSDKYFWQYKRIMMAMAQSGNGLSDETAFLSLSQVACQNFMREHVQSRIDDMSSETGFDQYRNIDDLLNLFEEYERAGKKMTAWLYFQIPDGSQGTFSHIYNTTYTKRIKSERFQEFHLDD
ncbi:MAG: DUF4919 domain-containing protein [Crocinitomicaceae bacterium]|nr:DUF4919 domain-containing protein [Crocinitomicaceae bacterium]